MRLRVAPPPASSRPVRVASPGCPVLRSLSPEPASESSGCPLVSVLRLCRRWTFELPRTRMPSAVLVSAGFRVAPVAPTSSCSAPDVGLGFPLVLHLRLYRRWIIESPRFSHLSAVPTCQFPSCPEPQPFGIADDSPPELPRASNPPAPIDGYPSYLGSRTIRFALVRSPSCPGHPPLATAIDQFKGCPKYWVSHRSPIHRLSSRPESWFLG